MKKKIIKIGLLMFAVLVFTSTNSVFAASSNIYNNKSYSVDYRGATVVGNKKASYAYAKADLVVNSTTTSSKSSTVFKAYLVTSSATTLKATKIISITPGTCTLPKSIGKIGKGTWTINNNTFANSTYYAGWSGELTYISSSEA